MIVNVPTNRIVDNPYQPPGFGRRDGHLHVIVGCVDNTSARAGIAQMAKFNEPHIWWLDCGNHDASGQVCLGNYPGPAPEISPLGFCVGLPFPSVLHPELVAVPKKKRGRRPAANCADDVLAGTQSLMVNQMVAAWAASYIHRLILGTLDCFAIYFDLHSGSARSEYIVKRSLDSNAQCMVE